MSDFDQRQLATNALPLIAVALMASGILVNTLPLESKRPTDIEQAKISHAGRQDVEARLWQDPFVAMRDVEGKTPAERCNEAIKDEDHHPSTLTGQIRYRQGRLEEKVTLLPVVIPGGPYFEDGESRQRSRYATVMALFKTGWVPVVEDKLGFVWTFESCVEAPWARVIPELLPYEWFRHEDKKEWLLILWVDEDAIARRPLRGIEQLTELIVNGGVPCPLKSEGQGSRGWLRWRDRLAKRLENECVCVANSSDAGASSEALIGEMKREAVTNTCPARVVTPLDPLAWERVPVIGPWTSTALPGLIRELARDTVGSALSGSRDSESHATRVPVRFYSASATAAIDDQTLSKAIDEECGRLATRSKRTISGDVACPLPMSEQFQGDLLRQLKEAFNDHLVRLTTTDAMHTEALVRELRLRLVDSTPYRLLPFASRLEALCDSTIVIVAEGDTTYARAFQEQFRKELGNQPDDECDENGINVEQVSYLRGLDGVFPRGDGVPQAAATAPSDGKSRPSEILLEQATLERADGPSQYDYLRRLAEHIDDLDRSERNKGRQGVSAIGVLGNDTYDKLLVLDALRDRLPNAVFFAADLDARLLAAGANRSTRNLVLASGFGLSLQPILQGNAPPFRDTYQTGTFLSVQVALDPDAHKRNTQDFAYWFDKPRLFEIGRTRPVNLIPPVSTGPDPDECNPLVPGCLKGIHADADWRAFDPLPSGAWLTAFVVMMLTSTVFAFLLSRHVRRAVHALWGRGAQANTGPLAVSMTLFFVSITLFSVALYYIYQDVRSADGEPFAWLEGVSIWPTQILRLIILFLTLALLCYGRMRLHANINKVAKTFKLETLAEREKERSAVSHDGLWKRLEWLWWLDDCKPRAGGDSSKLDDPWLQYLDRMRFWPSVLRIALTTALFFLFGMALMSLDWPNSPHRGADAALFSHVLYLIVLAAVLTLLLATFDASEMAARLLRHLERCNRLSVEPPDSGVAERYSGDSDLTRLLNRFRLAVTVSSSVNHLIYMPLISVLLLLPARSHLFDAWDFPITSALLLVFAVLLALGCATRLRRAARNLRAGVLNELDRKADEWELKGNQAAGVSAESNATPAAYQAELLRRIATEIREVRKGAFRPWLQEPVIRGILLLLGGTGGITTVEFLLLSGG